MKERFDKLIQTCKGWVAKVFKKDSIGAEQTAEGRAEAKATKWSTGQIVLTVIGIVLCVVLVPILLINVTIAIKGKANPEEVPGVFGVIPMLVLSGSMERGEKDVDIDEGDLIFLLALDESEIRNNDVVYDTTDLKYDEEGYARISPVYTNGYMTLKDGSTLAKNEVVLIPGDTIAFLNRDSDLEPIMDEGAYTYVTHRIFALETDKDGNIYYRTAGDYTGAVDTNRIPQSDVVGWYNYQGRERLQAWYAANDPEDQYKGSILKGVGDFIKWIATPAGIAVMVGVPVVGFILYDILRRQVVAKRALQAQLAEKAAQDNIEDTEAAVGAQDAAAKLAEAEAKLAELEALRAQLAAQQAAEQQRAEAPQIIEVPDEQPSEVPTEVPSEEPQEGALENKEGE